MTEPIETTIKIAELEILLTTIEMQKSEILKLYLGSMQVLSLLGLAKDGKVKAEAFEEEGNALPEILKEASGLMMLVMKAQVPVIGKQAEKELIQKFSFFSELIPLFIKYGNEFSGIISEQTKKP